jgi:hypothetical protein
MTSLIFLILALATWRVSSLLTQEPGPFHIFEKMRKQLGIVHDDSGRPIMIPGKFLPELFSCVWCLSIYVGFWWFLMWSLWPPFLWVAIVFALSGAAVIFDKFVR